MNHNNNPNYIETILYNNTPTYRNKLNFNNNPGYTTKERIGNYTVQFLKFKSSLLLKAASQAQVGETKLFINCLCSPTSTCATEN